MLVSWPTDPLARWPRYCPTTGCYLPFQHEGEHGLTPQLRYCDYPDCVGYLGHPPPHSMPRPHTPPVLSTRELANKLTEDLRIIAKKGKKQLEEVNQKVMSSLGAPQQPTNKVAELLRALEVSTRADVSRIQSRHPDHPSKPKLVEMSYSRSRTRYRPDNAASHGSTTVPYGHLDLQAKQIRLLELLPAVPGTSSVQGTFRYEYLSQCPPYTALSYTWGDSTDTRQVNFDGYKINVRENLWLFLRQQSLSIAEPQLFWIDALCINQSNIGEHNHQVGLMRLIYATATNVYIWLGPGSQNSDVAMNFLAGYDKRELRRQGQGYRRIWTREEGKAIYELCERNYWRRMWIIQEIIHTERITVWCGTRCFDWRSFERLYLHLKVLENENWFAHHPMAIRVLQSSACLMVWQRAHWRHNETPTPHLQMLIEIFQQWQCADVRDKVYALVGMASESTVIMPDYNLTPREVYNKVVEKGVGISPRFCSLLSVLLGLSGGHIGASTSTASVSEPQP